MRLTFNPVNIYEDHIDGDDSVLYRYVDEHDGWSIREVKYRILKETTCGYWITHRYWQHGRKRWVSKTGKNNFAKKTREEAMENYYHRKAKHVVILERQLDGARHRLEIARERVLNQIVETVAELEY